MFIGVIESAAETFPDVETEEFADTETCFYRWQHVAANRERAVV